MSRATVLAMLLLAAMSAMHAAAQDGHAGHGAPPAPPAEASAPAGAEQGHDEHAAHPSDDPHAGHDMPMTTDMPTPPGTDAAQHATSAPPAALSGPRHAADTLFGADVMAAAREQLRVEEGGFRTQMALADRFETRAGGGEESYLWDLQGWYGGDLHKLWWKSEGEGEVGGNPEDFELQTLYSRAITPFFDIQAGVRHDFRPSPQRSHAVVGIQGLLPYVFEIDAAAFLSDEGDVTGRFEAEYDLRIRQRLVLQPRVELEFAAQAIPELGLDSGLGSVEGGLRLRYEVRRELAPYVGVSLQRKVGGTADFTRAAGDDTRRWEAVIGVRAWF